MGINANGAEFLFYARSKGVDFRESLTIGRQNVYMTPASLGTILQRFGIHIDEDEIASITVGNDVYCERLFKVLGAKRIESVDYSDFEQPTFTHDMNTPIASDHKSQYSVVLDGGSLEHVFNFPIAIKNCMEMLQVGGHYLAITPANNFFGHGFYQFSPELYYSIFTPENGFEVNEMIAIEDVVNPKWYSVANPRQAGCRVTLCNSRPVYLLVIARKVASTSIFSRTPQQSDYTVMWNQTNAVHSPAVVESSASSSPIQIAKKLVPKSIRFWARTAWNRRQQSRTPKGFDSRYFKLMNKN